MMLILRDDPVLELFESPAAPPNWIEAIDVKNQEYSFCDDLGQMYVGVILKPIGWFQPETFELQPLGEPDILNALTLVDRAVVLEKNDWFPSLSALREHLSHHSSEPPHGAP